jgi:hypothetical protein
VLGSGDEGARISMMAVFEIAAGGTGGEQSSATDSAASP